MAQAKTKEDDAEENDTAPGAESNEDGEGQPGLEGGDGESGKSKKKIIVLAVLALVVLLGGAGGAYFMGFFGKHEEHASNEVGSDGKPMEQPVFYTLPEFVVNLNSSSKQSSFLKTTVILELPHQADVAQIEANLPRVLDTLNTYLRELRPSDLAGSAGIQRLREELLLRTNKTLAPTKINDILFKEIIVQ